ncbi:hypothetical protein CR513_37489, partial [Mucuna pruriens]
MARCMLKGKGMSHCNWRVPITTNAYIIYKLKNDVDLILIFFSYVDDLLITCSYHLAIEELKEKM